MLRRAKIDAEKVTLTRMTFVMTTFMKGVAVVSVDSMKSAVKDAVAAIEDVIGMIEDRQQEVAVAHLSIVIVETEGIARAGTK